MLFDAGTTDRAAFARPFDVCVVGAGPAGITLARRLAARGLTVALMEAGSFDYDSLSQDFYVGDCVGHAYFPLDECRLRFFGGTSGHWEGKCRPLEAHDFLPKQGWVLSGWPIRKADLDPYAAEASAILDLASPGVGPDLPLVHREPRFRRIQWQMSAPTRFGEKYRAEIVGAAGISLCLNANLVDLRLSPDLGTVTEARFRSYAAGDEGFTVRARAYALCLGGIENARMLLNFRDQVPVGIGNDRDLVGRYFCEHPTVFIGDMLLARTLPPGQRIFAATEAFLEREEVANFAVILEPREPVEPMGPGRALLATGSCLTPRIAGLVRRIRGFRPKCGWGGVEEYALLRDPEHHPWAKVAVTIEQRLNPDSRVLLSEEKDAFGLNRACLDWNLTEADFRTMRTAMMAFGAQVAEQDWGRLRLRDWIRADHPALPDPGSPHGAIAGRHHMCTTRMSHGPGTGVVDRDCRVHGVGNLYVGGSAVFSTGGFAKPTFTIVQLALRLGEHLGDVLT